LVHGDIGHGNIIVTTIGHPFLSAEHLLADFDRCQPHLLQEQGYLRQAYAEHWRGCTTSEALQKVTTLAPAVAAFAYAVMAWEASAQRPDPARTWPLLRSLLRRTRVELEHVSDVAA
jgi:hypothetical protein